MAVTRVGPDLIIMDAAADEYAAQGPINVKSVAFETADASANGTFDLRDESNANGGKNIVPKYDFVLVDLTPPAQFACESYVTNLEKIHLVGLPTAGRVFIYLNRR
jgi:hypothetical protein